MVLTVTANGARKIELTSSTNQEEARLNAMHYPNIVFNDGEVPEGTLLAQNNLSELEDKAAARTNLEVKTEAEIIVLITSAITNLVGGAPEALDTLYELAQALNDDEAFSATILAALGTLANLTTQDKTSLVAAINEVKELIPEDQGTVTETDITAINLTANRQINFDSASSSTSYTIASESAGGYAEILINTATEPTVATAIQLPNTQAWVANTDQVLCIKSFGGIVKYWYVTF